MNTSTLQSPYEHLVGADQDLGDGLFTAELFFWAERKRQQNKPHYDDGHRLCRKCKNCLCGETLSPHFGFRCMCAAGKTMLTPTRIRFQRLVDKNHAEHDEIYCLNHQIYEKRGSHA